MIIKVYVFSAFRNCLQNLKNIFSLQKNDSLVILVPIFSLFLVKTPGEDRFFQNFQSKFSYFFINRDLTIRQSD